MKYVFYITNHGFGHASRNVPIIETLLDQNQDNCVYVKSDQARCAFMKRNFSEAHNQRIFYYEDCKENGLILKNGEMVPDIDRMKQVILEDQTHWDEYIEREVAFLSEVKPELVIADVVCWALKAAQMCNVQSLLIGNFTWEQMYKSFYGEEVWGRYHEYYRLATKAVWYEIHAEELHEYCKDYELVSLVSRSVDKRNVEEIKNKYQRETVFVSLGASAELSEPIHVEHLPYEFLTTRGVELIGKNVHRLPNDMINTPDYIAACDYVIAKGGWSTVAEILLQNRKCALLFRGDNSEDNNTRKVLEERGHCVGFEGKELVHIEAIIEKIIKLNTSTYDIYRDDKKKICDIIKNI